MMKRSLATERCGTTAEVQSLHADSGTDHGRLTRALTCGVCGLVARPDGKRFCRTLV
ncbi:hypothetical protein SPHINGO391_280006 [Sphingomonas aurantiaca]|uniref:Uncharacterized protein n=1 Tax=Sphingomonas aurantiaca TaxID=185949 RepID=A0A5E7XX85_9SPHN|nr:hypothetical protein SPHINGO391_280006 [Sphingomonas aurantiaca]